MKKGKVGHNSAALHANKVKSISHIKSGRNESVPPGKKKLLPSDIIKMNQRKGHHTESDSLDHFQKEFTFKNENRYSKPSHENRSMDMKSYSSPNEPDFSAQDNSSSNPNPYFFDYNNNRNFRKGAGIASLYSPILQPVSQEPNPYYKVSEPKSNEFNGYSGGYAGQISNKNNYKPSPESNLYYTPQPERKGFDYNGNNFSNSNNYNNQGISRNQNTERMNPGDNMLAGKINYYGELNKRFVAPEVFRQYPIEQVQVKYYNSGALKNLDNLKIF